MRNLFIACLLLMGCSETSIQQPDMLTTDGSTKPGADMVKPQSNTDMAPRPNMLASPDMLMLTADMAHPVPDMTLPHLYEHTDSFCGNDGSIWMDTSQAVDPNDASTALSACMACCNYIGMTACGCTNFTGMDSAGSAYAAYHFATNTNPAAEYYFYYAGSDRAGTAMIASSNPSDRKSGCWNR
jgi:hypothetical protein